MLKWLKRPTYYSETIQFSTQQTPRNYRSLATEGYQRNVIVYRCVDLIAQNLASVPLLLYEGEHESPHHSLKKLLDHPNPYMNYQTFMVHVVSSYLLSGNAYIYTHIHPKDSELFPFRPDHIRLELSEQGHPKHYVYQENTRYAARLQPEVPAILHIRSYHPLNEWYGMSPLEPAASAIDQHNGVGQHNLSLLQNGGRPSGALILEDHLSEADRRQLRSDIENLYQSPQNAGRIMLLEGNFKWQELGLSPKNLDFLPGKSISAREIATAFGVSPLLVGLTEDASYNNYREARLQLWEETILPLLQHFVSCLNHWFHAIYPENLRIDFDLDAIPALSQRREEIWNKLKECDFLTAEEKRHALGYGPVSGR